MDASSATRAFEILARQVEAYVDATEPMHLTPILEGSRAQKEIEEHPEWPVRDAWTSPHLPLIVAEDHLRAIAAGARTPKLALGVVTAGRIALETAARGYWLVGEPDLSVRARVGRYYANRLSDLARTRDLAATLKHALGDDAAADAQRKLESAIAQGVRLGLAVPTSKRGLKDPVEVDGEQMPGPTRLAGIALSGDDIRWAELLYDRASAILHGRSSGVFSLKTSDVPTLGDAEPGVGLKALHKSTTDVALAVAAPLLTHATAVHRLALATGQMVPPKWFGTRDLLLQSVSGYLKAAGTRVPGQ